MALKFTKRYLQRLASLDARDPSVVQTRLNLLDDIGLERFLHLGPGVRFKASAFLPAGRSSTRLKAIDALPASQRELAKIAFLARTRFGQALLPPVYDKQREYGTLLGAVNWLGVEKFQHLAAGEYKLDEVAGQRHADRQIVAIRSSSLPVAEQERAVAHVLKSTALGQHVLEFGSVPPLPEDAWEEAILAYIGGPEQFLKVYKKPPFDVHTLPGIYDRSFATLVAQVQKLGLSKKDEERAYVALLSYSDVGKRLLDEAGLPQPPRTVRGRPLRPEKTARKGEQQPLQSHVDLLNHIGRDRFLELVKEPLFDLESLPGWETTGTAVPSRRRLIEQSDLTPSEKERALVALLALRPTPFINEHDLYRQIIRSTPQYQRLASGRANEYFFPKLLAEVGASRFVKLASQELYDLTPLLTAKDARKWGINRKFERVRRSNLSDEEKERAFVSILARSKVGKRYLSEARPKVKSELESTPSEIKPEPVGSNVKTETTASAVSRFSITRVPFAGCDNCIRSIGTTVVSQLPNNSTIIQAAALLGLIVQVTMSGV